MMAAVAASPAYSVSDLLREVNLQLYRFNDIAVEGEVSNFVPPRRDTSTSR
jgi:hypothetical protein